MKIIKKVTMILCFLFVAFVFLGGVQEAATIKKEGSRIQIKRTDSGAGYYVDELVKFPETEDIIDSEIYYQVYFKAPVCNVESHMSNPEDFYDEDMNLKPEAILAAFKRKDVLKHSSDLSKGLWARTARLLEVCWEIEYRLGRSDNTIEELALYKQLVASILDPTDTSATKCSDAASVQDDPLLYLGCGGNKTMRNWLLDELVGWGLHGLDARELEELHRNKSAKQFSKKIINKENDDLIIAVYEVLEYADNLNQKIGQKVTEYYQETAEIPNWGNNSGGEESGGASGGGPRVDVSAPNKGWWESAKEFFNQTHISGGNGLELSLVNELTEMIFTIGNMIFIIITSILGVTYIFGSAEGKANIKGSLITLIVAALFFYGWDVIKNLFDIGGLFTADTYQTAAQKVYNTILFIVNLLAIVGIIWIGVKYMLSSAQGKAEIKTNWGPLILGIIMVYATVKFLSTVVTIALG